MAIVFLFLPASLPAQDAVPADDPAVVYVLKGEHPLETLGTRFAPLGDIDGDGMADFAVTGEEYHFASGPNTGVVKVVSGKKGTVLRQFRGSRPRHLFGFRLASIEDLDGDGRPELGITADGGEVYIYSPVTGEALWERDIARDETGTRVQIQSVPNLAGDGRPGLVISDSRFAVNGTSPGRMIAVTVPDDEVIWVQVGDLSGGELGSAIVTISDLDGDGTPEICAREKNRDARHVLGIFNGRTGERMRRIGDGRDPEPAGPLIRLGDLNGDGLTEIGFAGLYTGDSPLLFVGAAFILDGGTFETLYRYDGHDRRQAIEGFDGDELGAAFSPVGDVDLDGVSDFVVVALRDSGSLITTYSRIFLRSGRTGGLLQSYEAQNGDLPFAYEVSALGDVTGDGRPEFLVGSPFDGPDGFSGEVRVLRFEPELPSFVRGDANLDGLVDVSDAVAIVRFVMTEEESAPCLRALDASGGGLIDFQDAIFLLKYFFEGRVLPPPPFPDCGRYRRLDESRPLPCEQSTCL